jgi:hypothetical protein
LTSPLPTDEEFDKSAAARLVERVLTQQFEQGCWLSACEARRYEVTSEEAAALQERWERLDDADRAELDALEERTTPGRPQELEPADSGDRFVIVTQQCDLIREPSVEATFEVVLAGWESDPNRIGSRRDLKSWREIVVAESSADSLRAALIADSRRRSMLDKRALLDFPARQALPDSGDRRRRFAYWAGARYYRRPVPHDLAVRVERPLKTAMRRDTQARALARQFMMFVLVVEDEELRLIGVFEREEDGDALERAFAELCETVPFEDLSTEACEVRHIAQMPASWVFGADAYPLDLESHSGKEDPLPPALESSRPQEEPDRGTGGRA